MKMSFFLEITSALKRHLVFVDRVINEKLWKTTENFCLHFMHIAHNLLFLMSMRRWFIERFISIFSIGIHDASRMEMAIH